MGIGVQTIQRGDPGYPSSFGQLHTPPKQLFYRGDFLPLLTPPRVAIVGTRRPTAYGRQVTRQLAGQLAEHGVVIVSGLALGVDAIAHQAALDAGGLTLAVLPSPVTHIAPPSNFQLSEQIIKHGGALLSTYPSGQQSHKGNFVARNEFVAAMSDVVVITEAAARSGTRHTMAFAQDQGVTVMAVPGPITNPMSAGPNSALRIGAAVVTSVNDILYQLGIAPRRSTAPQGSTPEEQSVLTLIYKGANDGEELLKRTGLSVPQFNQTLTMLEISGKITALGGNQWGLA
jgi:DNA processing protein